jgi:DNA-binding winged helix-turn-helix (wHTH) protein/Tol biopolymer transport system component
MADSRSNRSVRFQDFEVLLDSGELYKSGHRIKLSGQPMQVLTLLLDKAGQMVSREEIQKTLWPDTFVDVDHSLNAIVNRIREVLGDSAEEPRFVETLPRRGYRFIAAVERLPSPNSEALPEFVSQSQKQHGPRSLGVWLAILLAAGLTVIALSAFWEHHRPHENHKWVQLTSFSDSATSPTLSSDGRMLAFIRGPDTFVSSGQIYVKLLPNGEPFQVTHDNLPKMGPAFSPDGVRLAYTTTDAHLGWHTWVVPVLGGEPREILPNAAALTWLDREHVLFSEARAAGYHMAIVTATESRSDEHDVYVPPATFGVGMAHRTWRSPDGKRLLVVEMDGTGWRPCRLVSFDGESVREDVGPAGRCTYAGWSPDGQWMYFAADGGDGFHIWRQHLGGKIPEQLTFGPTEEEGIAIAADGRSLITSVGVHQENVWVHNASGDRQVTFEGDARVPGVGFGGGGPHPAFSPDGTKLFYLVGNNTARDSRPGAVWVVDLESGKSEPVLPGITVNSFEVAPDGKRIAFVSLNELGKTSVWMATLDHSTAPRKLTTLESAIPQFIQGGAFFFRETEAGADFVSVLKADEAGPQRVSTQPFLQYAQASPDGKWWVTGLVDMKATPMSGGPSIRVCDFCEVAWGSGGKYFYVRLRDVGSMGKGKVYVIEVPSGQTLPTLPPTGIHSADDFKGMNVVSVIDTSGFSVFSPGPNPTTYAYTRKNVQRNLFRIPLS